MTVVFSTTGQAAILNRHITRQAEHTRQQTIATTVELGDLRARTTLTLLIALSKEWIIRQVDAYYFDLVQYQYIHCLDP